jgi:uncharacterized protein YjbI with pentapeptide repeats
MVFIVLLAVSFAYAEQTVSASHIIDQINNNKDVSVKNAVISGTLDFTTLDNVHYSGGFPFGNKNYKGEVTVSLNFENCTFEDVIAFIYDDRERTSYIVDFRTTVRFINCRFNGSSEFKHSDFGGDVDFSGSRFSMEANFKHANFYRLVNFKDAKFQREANFKHADFDVAADFTYATFSEEGNFKHTKFSGPAAFSTAYFHRTANFKHTHFNRHADLENTVIDGFADFKHTHFTNDLNITGLKLNGDMTTKHATVGGQSFTKYLINKK